MNIRVVREAGGIGDIVRIIPVLRGLREQFPNSVLWVFAPDTYRPLLRGWYDEFRPTPWSGRRARDLPLDEAQWPYLNVGKCFARSVDLYCPAFRHEQRQRGEVWLDRIDLFCAAAAVTPSDKTPRVHLAPDDVAAGAAYIRDEHLRERGKLIALQPFSTDPARNWPLAQWRRLADLLDWLGHTVMVFDACNGRTSEFRQHRVIAKPLGFVAALLAQCDLLVAPDSGLGHLAAAVGTPTVGLFASQSGGVMYRHYPLHSYVCPPWDDRAHCRWPCFWNRPAECTRSALLASGRTCAMLARISVEDVYDAVAARLVRPCPEPSPKVSVPPMTPTQIRALGPCERLTALPIPLRDFSLDRLALTNGAEDLAAVLREASRVLRPGGVFLTPEATALTVRNTLAAQGFRISQSIPGGLTVSTRATAANASTSSPSPFLSGPAHHAGHRQEERSRAR